MNSNNNQELYGDPYRDSDATPVRKQSMSPQAMAALGAFLFTICPVDLIWDVIPLIGYFDDAGVWLVAILFIVIYSLSQKGGN